MTIAWKRGDSFWHGGFGGLKPGDFVLPPIMTKAVSIHDLGAEARICRRDRVYVTSDKDAACIWAALHPSGKGKLYEVEPSDPMVHDPDSRTPGLSWETPSALVLRVFTLSKQERYHIIRTMIDLESGSTKRKMPIDHKQISRMHDVDVKMNSEFLRRKWGG